MITSQRSWRVVANAPGARRAASIVLTDERYAPLRAFFFAIPHEQCARVVEAALGDVGVGFDGEGVIFAGDLDPGDRSLLPHEVEIYDPMTELRVPKREFLEVLLEVAEIVLAAYEANAEADSPGARELRAAVAGLRKRVTETEE